jgi:restriction endonuclease BglII
MRLRTFDYRHAELILSRKCHLKSEIECILSSLQLDTCYYIRRGQPVLPHRQIQRAFEAHGWFAEAASSPLTGGRTRFDLSKDGVAIEIETSSREYLYRDYFRFLLAESQGILRVGIIILLDETLRASQPLAFRTDSPRLADVVYDLRCLSSWISVPIWVVALR